MKIKKLEKILSVADEVRSLFKTSSGAPLSETIRDLGSILGNKTKWALCGGLAVGVHARPRGTDDVDILLENDSTLLYVMNVTSALFKRESDHVIVHRRTGVSVDLVTPEFINVYPEIVRKALSTAKTVSLGDTSIPVVSREGLVALKLCRGQYLDLGDIQSIIKSGGKVDVSGYNLTEEQKKKLKEIENENG